MKPARTRSPAAQLNVPNEWTYVPWNSGPNFNISGGSATLWGIDVSNGITTTINLSGSGAAYLGSNGIARNSTVTTMTISGGTLGAYASWSTTEPMTLSGLGHDQSAKLHDDPPQPH